MNMKAPNPWRIFSEQDIQMVMELILKAARNITVLKNKYAFTLYLIHINSVHVLQNYSSSTFSPIHSWLTKPKIPKQKFPMAGIKSYKCIPVFT
jgi:hypothetical protein